MGAIPTKEPISHTQGVLAWWEKMLRRCQLPDNVVEDRTHFAAPLLDSVDVPSINRGEPTNWI